MCKGTFTDGRPIVYAHIYFPAHLEEPLGIPPLQFLVDTGADSTLISVSDAGKLGIEYKRSVRGALVPFFGGENLDRGPDLGGIGGGIASYEVKDVLLVLVTWHKDCQEYHVEPLERVLVPEGKAKGVPSLLGWDVLGHFQLSCCTVGPLLDLTRVKVLGTYQVQILPLASA